MPSVVSVASSVAWVLLSVDLVESPKAVAGEQERRGGTSIPLLDFDGGLASAQLDDPSNSWTSTQRLTNVIYKLF